MINYFNFKEFGNGYIITNDAGKYQFIDSKTLKQLVLGDENTLLPDVRQELEDNLFLFRGSQQEYINKVIPYIRDIKNYLFQSTALFIFVLTNACNLRCVYCQAQSGKNIIRGVMSEEIAEKGVDIALSSPSPAIDIEFQGGEPLLNFGIIKHIIEYTERKKGDKCVSYNLVSNLSLLSDEIADYLVEHNVHVSVSLDGDEYLHNLNRPFIGGEGSYPKAIRGIKMFQERGVYLGALETTTKNSIARPKEIVDSYVALGFHSIFLRPLTQLGFANDHWEKIGYSAETFLEFYRSAMDYIIELNKQGVVLSEGHATIFLKKILNGRSDNYMELRSPCGATVGQMAIYYDGNIYTCDEGRMVAEMGDPAFCLGNVYESDYNSLIESGVCKTLCNASCLEAIPRCSDCVYQPYCGVCPVINYAIDNDIFSKSCYNDSKCIVYSGILDYLFTLLKGDNQSTIGVLERWV